VPEVPTASPPRDTRLPVRVSWSVREGAPGEHRDVLGAASGLQLAISGLEAVINSVGSCRWGVAELIGEAVSEDAVVGGAGIGVEQVWEGALFDLAEQQSQVLEGVGDVVGGAEPGAGIRLGEAMIGGRLPNEAHGGDAVGGGGW
jgi:hypothetical protein